jgi:7-alpha-hydroxysteroid dehydrogenase
MVMEQFRLDDKIAVVSGGGKGIGAGIARGLAEAGAHVVIASRTRDDLLAVASEIESFGRSALTVVVDLSNREGMAHLVDCAIERFGAIDIVVNNVGGSRPSPIMQLSEDAFRTALEWNVVTAFNLSQLAIPHLLQRPGASIVNIASAAGRFASRGFVAYSTAKAAMMQLTRTLAADLAPKIRVNCVAPGAILTDALKTVLGNEVIHSALITNTPMKRIGTVEDVAAAAIFLASPAASYITGRILEVDGGIQTSNLPLPIPDL